MDEMTVSAVITEQQEMNGLDTGHDILIGNTNYRLRPLWILVQPPLELFEQRRKLRLSFDLRRGQLSRPKIARHQKEMSG